MTVRRAAAALALLAAAACSPSPGSPTAQQGPALSTQKCADLIVLGARGSTQSASKNFGAGTEVRRSVTAMAERLHKRSDATVRLVGVPYPADGGPEYTAQVFKGVDATDKLLTKLSNGCPDSQFGLVGFSQGAQTIHGFAVTMTAAEIDRVALVAMISDPRHNPDDEIASWSYADEVTAGNGKLGAGTPLPKALRGKAIHFCAEKDEICNWPVGGFPGPLSDTHRHFYEEPAHAEETGDQLAKILEANGI